MNQNNLEEKVFRKEDSFLKNFLWEANSLDMGYTSKRFTWENKQHGFSLIKERLDIAIANRSWLHHCS